MLKSLLTYAKTTEKVKKMYRYMLKWRINDVVQKYIF